MGPRRVPRRSRRSRHLGIVVQAELEPPDVAAAEAALRRPLARISRNTPSRLIPYAPSLPPRPDCRGPSDRYAASTSQWLTSSTKSLG
jgi:hypothetical protein